MNDWFGYAIVVVAIGAFVGGGELVARYKDAPATVFRLAPAWLYVALNGAAAGTALYLMRTFDWTFGGKTDQQEYILQLIVAGFGSMAFLRSSLFTVKVGDTDVAVGPSVLLTVLLNAADRTIDRSRGEARVKVAREVMKNFDVDANTHPLINIVLAAMQNLSNDEITQVVDAATAIVDSAGGREEKATTVGLLLLGLAGEDLLKESVASFE